MYAIVMGMLIVGLLCQGWQKPARNKKENGESISFRLNDYQLARRADLRVWMKKSGDLSLELLKKGFEDGELAALLRNCPRRGTELILAVYPESLATDLETLSVVVTRLKRLSPEGKEIRCVIVISLNEK